MDAGQNPGPKRLLAVSQFSCLADNVPRAADPVTWGELVRRLSRHRERDRQDGELWSPTEYLPSTLRKAENVLALHCFVLDMDAGEHWMPYVERWEALGLAFAIHSTYRHTEAVPRWRAVFPLKEVQPGGEAWTPIWERLAWGLARHTADPQCKDAGRMYFLPSHPRGRTDAFALSQDGEWLDPTQFPDPPPPPPRPRSPQSEIPREQAGRVEGTHLVDRALDIARSGDRRGAIGRHAGCKWLMQQLCDNRFSEGEARSLGDLFVSRCPSTDTKGEVRLFEPKEMERLLAWAYSKGPREPWTPPTPKPPHPADDPAVLAQAPPPDRAPEEAWTQTPPDDPEPDGPDMPGAGSGEQSGNQSAEQPGEPDRAWRTFTFDTMAEQGLEEPEFPVAGLLREGVNLFMGKTGDGKTFWSVDVSIAVATGGKALGHREVIQGDVLYLALEESRAEMFQRMLQLRDETEHRDLSRLEVASAADEDWPVTSMAAMVDAIEEWLTLHPGARLVVLDPLLGYLALATAPAQQFLQAEYNIIRNLRMLARRHPGVAILVHDHRSKAQIGNGREPMDTGVHSTGLIASVDNRMVLVKEEGLRFKLTVKGRSVPMAELIHVFDPSTGGWEIREDGRTLRQSDVAVLLLKALQEIYPESKHAKELAEIQNLPHGTVKGRLFRMERAGSVIRTAPGCYRAASPGGLWDDSGSEEQ
jgi:hypothetical protein